MRYASIDIGTNTLRLLVAESDGKRLSPIIYKRIITRLGGGYTELGGIDAASAERTLVALEEFKSIIDVSGVSATLAFATSVVRRAVNRDRFTDEVFRRTGIEVAVISGDEEARLSLLGVLSVMDDPSKRSLVMDIGGGSTEFISSTVDGIEGAWSMEMGVVHLTERFLLNDPPSLDDLASIETEVMAVLRDLKGRMVRDGVSPARYSCSSGALLIGTAGTITTLAAIDQDLTAYNKARINNYSLGRSAVERIYGRLIGMTLRQREEFLSLERGREDLIIPGTLITLLVMEFFGFDEIKVSDAGLLEGIILGRVRTQGSTGGK